jgi:hypothetical protein
LRAADAPGSIYGLDEEENAELIRALHETVWHVVMNHPHTGLAAP